MNKQRGITLIGMVLTIAVVVIAAIVVMRVVPVYLQNYEIRNSIKALNGLEPSLFSEDYSVNSDILRKKLTNQLDVNGITDINPNQVKIVPSNAQPGSYKVSVKYKVIKPLFANVSLLFDFDNSEEVKVGPH